MRAAKRRPKRGETGGKNPRSLREQLEVAERERDAAWSLRSEMTAQLRKARQDLVIAEQAPAPVRDLMVNVNRAIEALHEAAVIMRRVALRDVLPGSITPFFSTADLKSELQRREGLSALGIANGGESNMGQVRP